MFAKLTNKSLTNFNLFNNLQLFNFATKMRATVTKNKKDSAGKRLGLKKFGGEEIRQNQIIIRQRGFKYKPGENVHFGKDHTIHSSKEGIVKFTQDPWSRRRKVSVHVIEQEIPNRKVNILNIIIYNYK
jgi:large subunit ribosomal protein L27